MVVVVAVAGMSSIARAQPGAAVEPAAASAAVRDDECLQRRRDIYASAAAQEDMSERVRLLESMPVCKVQPAIRGEPAADIPIARSPVDERPPVHAAERSIMSITFSPALLLLGALMRGVALDLRAELRAMPHLGLGITGTAVRVKDLLSDDVNLSLLAVRAEVAWYQRVFSGLHGGAAALYGHGWQSGGTGFLGGEVEPEDRALLGSVVFAGWKWLGRTGWTTSLRASVLIAADPAFEDIHVGPGMEVHVGGSL